ncbi:MAG: hypothetical protein II943_03680 [Victivallales bacterium]|nr:hypothetical protein [Victivallales bacterium]
MNQNPTVPVTMQSVQLIGRVAKPLMEAGLIPNPEYQTILLNLKRLSRQGELMPSVAPRLITREEAAGMLGLTPDNFLMLEKRGQIKIPRRKIGRAVRYLNLRVLEYILAEGGDFPDNSETSSKNMP